MKVVWRLIQNLVNFNFLKVLILNIWPISQNVLIKREIAFFNWKLRFKIILTSNLSFGRKLLSSKSILVAYTDYTRSKFKIMKEDHFVHFKCTKSLEMNCSTKIKKMRRICLIFWWLFHCSEFNPDSYFSLFQI